MWRGRTRALFLPCWSRTSMTQPRAFQQPCRHLPPLPPSHNRAVIYLRLVQYYICHATAAPLEKGPGNTVCYACGLVSSSLIYILLHVLIILYSCKLHSAARPISRKCDVIRKLFPQDARRAGCSESLPAARPFHPICIRTCWTK